MKEPQALTEYSGITVSQNMTLSEMATTFYKSNFFKDAQSASQAAVKIIAGQELGLTAIESMKGIHVYDGNIELHVTTMKALIKRSGIYRTYAEEGWITATGAKMRFDEKIDGKWSPCEGSGIVEFTSDDAKRAGLLTKNPWQKYPEDMFYARCLSRGFRRFCPELTGGPVYMSGEIDEERSPLETPIEFVETEPNLEPDPSPVVESPEEPANEPTVDDADSGTTDTEEAEVGDEKSKSADLSEQEPPPKDAHPFGRFCKKTELIKAQLYEMDGDMDRYYRVLNANGLENKGQVPKGDTELMRTVVLDLQDAIKEAQMDKINIVVEELDGEVVTEAAGLLWGKEYPKTF
tara:strand:+ start:1105 stop:2151 length:1047 start_codon:yes stop_codon:yes gene_type:complete